MPISILIYNFDVWVGLVEDTMCFPRIIHLQIDGGTRFASPQSPKTHDA